MKKASPAWTIIIALAIIKFLLPFILTSSYYELHRDEYLYYQQGLHPSLGYMENPPLLSWLGTLSSFFGGTEFWIRFWPGLIGSLTLIITCLLTAEWGGKRFAQFLAGIAMMTGAMLRIFFLFQPNVVDVFFWTLSIYSIVRFLTTGNDRALLWFFISLALAFLSKYSALFIGASILLSLMLTRERKIFTRRNFYVYAGIALLIILPNAWWQFSHNWPLMHHMKELQETQLQFLSPGDFIKDQFLFILPAVFVWIAGLVWLFRSRAWRFLFYTYFFVIVLLLLGRGKSYYSLGIYPMLLAAGGVTIENWTARRQWARYALPAIIIILTLPLTPLLFPVWKPEPLAAFYRRNKIEALGLLKWEDQQNHPLPQDFADMTGWKELSQKTEKFYNSLPGTTRSVTSIFASNYGQAGALKYYGEDQQFTKKVASLNGSFLLWMPERVSFQHLLLVSEQVPDSSNALFHHFAKMTIVDSVANPYSRQLGNKIIFYENIDSAGLNMAANIIKQYKDRFR